MPSAPSVCLCTRAGAARYAKALRGALESSDWIAHDWLLPELVANELLPHAVAADSGLLAVYRWPSEHHVQTTAAQLRNERDDWQHLNRPDAYCAELRDAYSDAFKALVTSTNGIESTMSWRQWIREIAELQRQEL